jgi:hypothetical protein
MLFYSVTITMLTTKIINGMSKIAAYAKANDPKTTKHATHISLNPEHENVVWVIEE